MPFTHPPAYQPFCQRLGLELGIPHDPNWSAAPDFLDRIADHCLQHRPQHIVECSSGLTTLALAKCCETNNRGKVISLENGPEYAEATREALLAYQLDSRARVLDAALVATTTGGQDFLWYSLADDLPERIDMLVIDGPPGFIQPFSRFPAVPLLAERLAAGCTVFLDDAARPDEREIARRWQAALPLARFTFHAEDTRGTLEITLP